MDREIPKDQTAEPSPNEKKNKKSASRFRPSRLLDAFVCALCAFFTNGFFGRVLTAYSREENAIRRALQKRKKQRSVHEQPIFTDHRVARFTERIFLTRFFKRIRYLVMKCPFSYYADAVVVYALVSLLANLLMLFFTDTPTLNTGIVLTTYALDTLKAFVRDAIFWVDLSLLILFSLFCYPIRSRSIHDVKKGSVILSTFYERVLGAKGELAEELQSRNSDLENGVLKSMGLRLFLLLFGLLAGVFSAFASPFWILLCLTVFLFATTVIRTPEAGLILSVFLVPFLSFSGKYEQILLGSIATDGFYAILRLIGIPSLTLALCVLWTTIAFFIKVLRKKRLFRFGLFDAAVLLVATLILIYGFYPYPSLSSVSESILFITFMMIYFLASNLLRSEVWLARVLRSLQFSVFLSLTAGIYVYFFGVPDLGWFPTQNMSGEIGNVAAFYGGEQFLGAYLVLMLPLSLGSVFSSHSVWSKILGAMSLPEIAFVAFLLPSRLALLTCLCGGALFAILCTYKALYGVPLLATLSGVAYQLVPNGVSLWTFLKDFMKATFYSGISLWDRYLSTGADLPVMGVGFGLIRYGELASSATGYREAGFLMKFLFEMGIPGILVGIVFLVIFVQMCLEELRLSRGSHLRPAVAGCFTAIVSVLGYGIFMPVLSDARMMFFFWLTIGLSTAYRRVCTERRNDRSFLRQQPMSDRNADIIVY